MSGNLFLQAFISQRPSAPNFASIIAWVLHSVHDRHLREVERADAFQARNVDTILVRVRATLVMCVNTALRTKEVLGFTSIESVAS